MNPASSLVLFSSSLMLFSDPILVTIPQAFCARSASRLPSFCSRCLSFLLTPRSHVPLYFMSNYNDTHFICIMFYAFWSISHTLSCVDAHINPVGKYYYRHFMNLVSRKVTWLAQEHVTSSDKIDLEAVGLLYWITRVLDASPPPPPCVMVGVSGTTFVPASDTIMCVH